MGDLEFRLDPEPTAALRDEVVALWTAVSAAGGAVGFVPPVTEDDVRPAADAHFAAVAAGRDRLLTGRERDGGRLVALLFYCDAGSPLMRHWRTLKRVMVDPGVQGRGAGRALMLAAEDGARGMGLSGLRLTLRGGLGLEGFYESCGYREVGRVPGAIRVGPGDDRDDVTMWMELDRP